MDVPDNLKEFVAYHRRMFTIMTGVCLAVLTVMMAVKRGDWALAGGFAAGAAARLVKFRFLDIAVVRKIALEKKNAAATQLKSMAAWLLLFGLATAAVLTLNLNIWAMVAGIFLPPVLLVADTYLRPNLFSQTPPGGGGEANTEESR